MLEPAGSFDHDALEAVSGEAFEERCDRLFVVGNAEREVSFEQVEVEFVFADIDTGIDGEKLLGHGYSVLLNSGS